MLNIPIFVKLEWGITLADIVEQEALVYPSFGDLVNVIIQVINHLHVNAIAFYSTCKGNKTGTKSII